MLFQGLESQAWPLTHYEHDTFSWLQPFNEQARRARFNLAGLDTFKLKFMAGKGNGDGPKGEIDRVCWAQESGLAEEDQFLFRKSKHLPLLPSVMDFATLPTWLLLDVLRFLQLLTFHVVSCERADSDGTITIVEH